MKRVLVAACIAAALAACARRTAHPNVLVITLDTFRADRIGALTPHLRQLENEGVSFAQADSAVPLTLPSHATILSGLLPLHHGVRNNGAGAMGRATLASAFTGGGYRTGAFVSAFVLDHRFGLDRGFDVYDDEVPRDVIGSGFEAERRGAATVDRALAWLRQPDARPWFAWVHLYDAHAPYAPPAPFPQTYDGEIAYVDEQVGRLLGAVDRRSTIVVVAGDHGEALGEHGEITHGLFVYESTLHVPFVIAGPDIQHRTINDAVSLTDIAPTVASLAGLDFAPVDGRSLADPVRRGAAIEPRPVYSETEYPRAFGWTAFAALRRENLKVTTAREVFDLGADPSEKTNVIDAQRRVFADLGGRLQSLRATAVAAAPTGIDAESRKKLASLGYVAPQAASRDVAIRPPAGIAALFRRFEEANWLIVGGKAADAVAALQALVHDDPDNPTFRSTLARALRESGRGELALPLYRQAVALAPDDADAWYDLATTLQENDKAEEAAAVMAQAEKLDARRPEIHDLRGVALAASGDLANAETEFRKALEIDPRDARAYNNLGNVLRVTNRPDDAAAAYRRAIELAPRYADPLNGLGALLAQNGRPDEALQFFDAALNIAPDYYEAQLNRGIAFSLAGRGADARAEWRRLLARLPSGAAYASQRKAAQTLLSQR